MNADLSETHVVDIAVEGASSVFVGPPFASDGGGIAAPGNIDGRPALFTSESGEAWEAHELGMNEGSLLAMPTAAATGDGGFVDPANGQGSAVPASAGTNYLIHDASAGEMLAFPTVDSTFYDEDQVAFVGDHRAVVVVASIALVLGGLWWQHRTGRSSLDDLVGLEHATDDTAPDQ